MPPCHPGCAVWPTLQEYAAGRDLHSALQIRKQGTNERLFGWWVGSSGLQLGRGQWHASWCALRAWPEDWQCNAKQ